MPRFVILEHDHPVLHWDLMLETGEVLATWRIPAPPPSDTTQAVALGDHRRAYLDYEGPVSGGRGTVKRWDAGVYETLERGADFRRIRLHGARWQGIATLTHVGERWAISFEAAS